MNQHLPVLLFSLAVLLPGAAATAQTDAPAPTSLRQALEEWSWTWTGPRSNTTVTFQPGGKLVTQENQVSHWDMVNAGTVRVSSSSARSVIHLSFNRDFSRFVQVGGGVAPIAGMRSKMVAHMPLLDAAHESAWKLSGSLPIKLQNGLVDTASPRAPGFTQSILWYAGKKFADFSLKLEFKRMERRNSGIFVRFADPGNDPRKADSTGYEIDLNGVDDTGAIVHHKRPDLAPEKLGAWNEMEISAIGPRIRVYMNQKLINDFQGASSLTGHIGLQNWEGGVGVQFRNVRIKELPASALAASTPPVADTPAAEMPRPQGAAHGGMALAGQWMPNTLESRRLLLRSLGFYAKAVVGDAPRGKETVPSIIVGQIRWLMPLEEAIRVLPAGMNKLGERPVSLTCFPDHSLSIVSYQFKSFMDRNQPFNQVHLIVDLNRKVVGVQFVQQAPEAGEVQWNGGPDGAREPYYNFLMLSNNGNGAWEVAYQIADAGNGVKLIKTVLQTKTGLGNGARPPGMPGMQPMPMPGMAFGATKYKENVHLYLTAPLARCLIDIAELHLRKMGASL